MLYKLHEFQKALLQPVSSWARAASEAFINASNPVSRVPGSERLAASYELLYRLGKDYKNQNLASARFKYMAVKSLFMR